MKQVPNIVTLENKKLVGQSIEMSLVENKTFELFSSFMPQRKEIKNALSTDIFEVLLYDNNYLENFNPANTFTKWASVAVENYNTIPEGMKNLNLDSGLYAVFNYKGLPKDFGVFMSYIYTNWLPKSKYQLDQRPHFNLLGEKAKRNNPDSEETVWIPIKLK
ncbi:GyrI-like domain-containing protein [Lacinutrix sp. Bg11-31]|uniref:GyrI-like domain-containing protein n=1 Tax=Lacinutrix sp. Bg11-31 TaxID=2057808 RepID=UPI000C3054F1|nr:GyrI-like domain-containing protein [Lacinutrix sp. Bg11-31]AUC81967.1 GyrI-like domain-containing protein [Lacinutrix sp. Bg11-31]